MLKTYVSRLLQASLMCCIAVLFAACDDFFGSEDNPTSSYLAMSEKPVTINEGETYKRTATSTTTAEVYFSSSDTNVATVDNDGVVTALCEGTATITATATGYSKITGKKIYVPASVSYVVIVKEPALSLSTPLTMKALTAGTIVINHPKEGMKYAINGGAKTVITSTDNVTIDVAIGDKVKFYGNGTDIKSYFKSLLNFTGIIDGTADVKLYGNIMSLVDETGFAKAKTLTEEGAFRFMFYQNTHILDASGLLLPATTLSKYCYGNMFYGCTNLTTAPVLPATTLAPFCYDSMFESCSSLATAPELPATTLAEGCYLLMFARCSELTTAPALPATTLAEGCYCFMFISCSKLATAPALPATTLAESCYGGMFGACSSLTATPELPAPTLVKNCYQLMFAECPKLSSVTCLATDISADGCTKNWLLNSGTDVTGEKTFYKAASMTGWGTDESGTNGWTVKNKE